jgi:hypothetical protein
MVANNFWKNMLSPSIMRNCSIAQFLRLGAVVLFAVFMAACGGGAGTVGIATGVALFTTAPSTVSIPVGTSTSYSISGGTPIYKTSSSNPTIAATSIASNGTTLNIIGVTSGTSQISVSDAVGAIVTISVTVGSGATGTTGTTTTPTPIALFTTAPSAITVTPGGAASFNIGGGTAPYLSSTSNANVATTGVTGTTLSIVGVAAGTAQVTVVDSTGTAVSINVTIGSGSATTVTQLYTTAASAVVIAPAGTATFNVAGGTAPYTATSSNKNIATAGLSGSVLSMNGLVAGTAQILVFDATGASVAITVTVSSGETSAAGTALYTTSASAVTITLGGTNTYSIGGGTAPYVATSSNTGVATASISGATLTVNGVAAGSAQVLVFDATGASVTITVTVSSSGIATTALYTTSAGAVTLAAGGTNEYTIGGGTAPYLVSSSDTSVAIASIASTTLTVRGITAGTAQILVFDATGASVAITVTVSSSGIATTALYTTSASAVTVSVGGTNTYSIGGGTAPYLATSSNTGVAIANVTGTVLTITGNTAGAAQVLVFDATGASVTIGVTAVQAASPLINVQPNGATGSVGDVLQFLFIGGTPGYTATATDTSIATLSAITANSKGGTFTATLMNVGSTNVTIVDSTGQTQSFTLTATQTSALLRLSPSALLIAEDSVNNIAFNIYGGTGPYSAFTSDQTLSSVTISGATLTVGLGTNGNRCINPINSSGTYIPDGTYGVTITVVDSLGASATAVMTIQDNGIGTGSLATQPTPFAPPCH